MKWEVTKEQIEDCKNKGKDAEVGPCRLCFCLKVPHVKPMSSALSKLHPQMDCKNYIRILHTTGDGRMYVCGTNAFDPTCDYMVRLSDAHSSSFTAMSRFLPQTSQCVTIIGLTVFVCAVLQRQ